MGKLNYRMNVFCLNCWRWQVFDIPKGVSALSITSKRKCKHCECIFGNTAIPVSTEQAREMKKYQREMVRNLFLSAYNPDSKEV